jgi:hypothetical protein
LFARIAGVSDEELRFSTGANKGIFSLLSNAVVHSGTMQGIGGMLQLIGLKYCEIYHNRFQEQIMKGGKIG